MASRTFGTSTDRVTLAARTSIVDAIRHEY